MPRTQWTGGGCRRGRRLCGSFGYDPFERQSRTSPIGQRQNPNLLPPLFPSVHFIAIHGNDLLLFAKRGMNGPADADSVPGSRPNEVTSWTDRMRWPDGYGSWKSASPA